MDFNSWICKIMLRSRVMPSLLTWNAIAAFSEEHVAKLFTEYCYYLVVSSALAIGSCKSEKRAARLC